MPAYRYPHRKHRRKHGPQGYQTAADFRSWLRDEFSFRCVYCLEREQWGNRLGYFHVEHFLPVAERPELSLSYDNLLYSCQSCNLRKNSQTVPDPLQVFRSGTVSVRRDGSILGRTKDAKRLIELLRLNNPSYRKRRRMMLGILAAVARTDPALHRELLGYPDDLPDLSVLKPPAGNSRPAGVKQSFFACRQSGRLRESY